MVWARFNLLPIAALLWIKRADGVSLQQNCCPINFLSICNRVTCGWFFISVSLALCWFMVVLCVTKLKLLSLIKETCLYISLVSWLGRKLGTDEVTSKGCEIIETYWNDNSITSQVSNSVELHMSSFFGSTATKQSIDGL